MCEYLCLRFFFQEEEEEVCLSVFMFVILFSHMKLSKVHNDKLDALQCLRYCFCHTLTMYVVCAVYTII